MKNKKIDLIEKLKGQRKSLHRKCLENGGCEKIEEMIWGETNAKVYVCSVYLKPTAIWNRGFCLVSTNHQKEEELKKKKFINPLKASKRRG